MRHPWVQPHLVIALLLLSLPFGCATPPEAPASSASLDYLILNGLPDYRNRYPSVVQIMTGRGTCSGVLIKPRLVLTAAHCFCLPSQLAPERAYRYTRRGGSLSRNEVKLSCSEKAEVIATIYSLDGEVQEDASGDKKTAASTPKESKGLAPLLKARQGSVRIHNGYEFYTDAAGNVAASKMDLAAVHLDKPLEGIHIDNRLASREVQPEETLAVVGYGLAPDQRWGIRHFGKNQVMDINISVGGDGLFAFRGRGGSTQSAHAWRGDSGGPCFREDPGGSRWLTGIISTGKLAGADMVTIFTSVFHHRAWIERQISENALDATR